MCLKKDEAHQEFVLQQNENVNKIFSETVQQASSTASACSQFFEAPSVQTVDVDVDDLPLSQDMDIVYTDDNNPEWEDKGSIISEPEEVVREAEDDKEGEVIAGKAMEAAMQALSGLNLEDLMEAFNFLLELNLEDVREGDAGPGPSTMAYRMMCHNLVANDTES
jgi:hypothetical protein